MSLWACASGATFAEICQTRRPNQPFKTGCREPLHATLKNSVFDFQIAVIVCLYFQMLLIWYRMRI